MVECGATLWGQVVINRLLPKPFRRFPFQPTIVQFNLEKPVLQNVAFAKSGDDQLDDDERVSCGHK